MRTISDSIQHHGIVKVPIASARPRGALSMLRPDRCVLVQRPGGFGMYGSEVER